MSMSMASVSARSVVILFLMVLWTRVIMVDVFYNLKL